MRKIVTFIAFLSFLLTVSSCESKVGDGNNADEHAQKNSSSKVKKGNKAFAKRGVQFSSDSIPEIDTLATKSQIDAILEDSLANKLPLPESDNIFETDLYDEDTLDFEDENYEEADWVEEEINPEDDEEYVDYSNGDLNLQKERILKTEIVIVQIPELLDERDSVLAVIEERMSINADEISKQIVVEKWYSPVNYRGYKFNRKKLMLYGIDKAALISIYYYLGVYYFELNNRLYDLEETSKNTAFETVGDSVLTNYLLKHDNKL